MSSGRKWVPAPQRQRTRWGQLTAPWARACSSCFARASLDFPAKITHSFFSSLSSACPHLPHHCHFRPKLVAIRTPMHANVTSGCSWLLCCHSRPAEAFTNFLRCMYVGVERGQSFSPDQRRNHTSRDLQGHTTRACCIKHWFVLAASP